MWDVTLGTGSRRSAGACVAVVGGSAVSVLSVVSVARAPLESKRIAATLLAHQLLALIAEFCVGRTGRFAVNIYVGMTRRVVAALLVLGLAPPFSRETASGGSAD
jgi:hypothetical protein